MGHKFIIILFLIFFSCDNKQKKTIHEFEDVDILNNANIAISKGDQKIVNAVATKLLKDETHIYLKAYYNSLESSKIRSKLSQAMIQNPSYSNMIKKLSLECNALRSHLTPVPFCHL